MQGKRRSVKSLGARYSQHPISPPRQVLRNGTWGFQPLGDEKFLIRRPKGISSKVLPFVKGYFSKGRVFFKECLEIQCRL